MTLSRVPIRGWKKCIYEASSFESSPEYHAAKLLDMDTSVQWWFRNDPPRVLIPTPAGYLEPDFVYMRKIKGADTMSLLEIKGEHLWNGPGSSARIKAAGAASWAKAVFTSGLDPKWEFHEVLGQDAEDSETLGGMLSKAVERFEVTFPLSEG